MSVKWFFRGVGGLGIIPAVPVNCRPPGWRLWVGWDGLAQADSKIMFAYWTVSPWRLPMARDCTLMRTDQTRS